MIKTNYMKLKSYLLVAVSVLAFVGCKKDYLDVNTNPNQLTSATPSFVLTGALNTTTQNLVLANETGSYLFVVLIILVNFNFLTISFFATS